MTYYLVDIITIIIRAEEAEEDLKFGYFVTLMVLPSTLGWSLLVGIDLKGILFLPVKMGQKKRREKGGRFFFMAK